MTSRVDPYQHPHPVTAGMTHCDGCNKTVHYTDTEWTLEHGSLCTKCRKLLFMQEVTF